MVYAIINGKVCYPESNTNIKLTFVNPFLKNQGDHTYQVTFPLSIDENQEAFGTVNRIEVAQKNVNIREATLYCDNRVIVKGTAKVISYTEKSVKVQILGGASGVKELAQETFIDHLEYEDVAEPYMSWCGEKYVEVNNSVMNMGYAGVKGKYVFFTVRNEETGEIYNYVTNFRGVTDIVSMNPRICRPCLQPNLVWVIKQVFSYLGYTVADNILDCEPWNCLYIVNLKRTKKIQSTLPHWKIKTFLEEIRNLFNLAYIYDDQAKTVSIKASGTAGTVGTVTYESISEFETEYDDEGISYLGSDNIKYTLEECAEQPHIREIPQEVFNTFEVLEYDRMLDYLAAVDGMTDQQKRTHLFHVKHLAYIYWRQDGNGNLVPELKTGIFQPLVRSGDNTDGNTTELKISPVPIGYCRVYSHFLPNDKAYMPCVSGPETDVDTEDENEAIVTVQDVIENGVTKEEDSEDGSMRIAFLAERSERHVLGQVGSVEVYKGILTAFADHQESNATQSWSLSLTSTAASDHCIGHFHQVNAAIDPHMQYVIKFICEEVPDPNKTYIFNNRSFLCAKIEANMTNGKIDKLMTGYFYQKTD